MKNYLRFATAVAAGLSALAVVSCNSWAPVQETDASKYELRGNVASFRTISYKVDSTADGYRAGAVDPMSQNIYVEFNKDGNATLLRRFNKEGKEVSEQTSVYNEKGQLLESELVSAAGELLEKTVNTYKRGRLHSMKVTDGMDSLKQVVVPISYHTMPEMMEDFSSSEVLVKYYGMYMDYPPARFSFELTIPRWYDKILMQLRGESVCKSDSLGFGTDYMPEPDNLDEEHALSTVAYHTHKDFSHVDENMRILEHIISECGRRGVKVILLTTPVTDLYCDNLDVRQLELMHACADSLASWHDNVVYWDFMRDARFSYGDFHDVDHLAVNGAEKFSRILSDSIKSLYR